MPDEKKPRKKPPGRKPLLLRRPTLAKDICDGLRMGLTLPLAAARVRVGESTVYQWIDKGEKPDAKPCYREFAESAKAAEAECAYQAMEIIKRAFSDSWQSAAWYMERVHGYRSTQEVHHITAKKSPLEQWEESVGAEVEIPGKILRFATGSTGGNGRGNGTNGRDGTPG